MISLQTLVRGLAILGALAAGLPLLLGFFGAHAARLDALAPFRWHCAAALAMALLAVVWPRRIALIAVIMPLVILGGPVLLAHWPGGAPLTAERQAPGEGPQHALKLVSFNTWDQVRNLHETHEFLRQADADVVVLVELSPPKRALLEVLKPHYPFQMHCADHWPCSMALLSKWPLEAGGTVRPSATMPAAVWGRIAGEGGGLTVIGVHVNRPTRSTRLHSAHMRGVAAIVRTVRGGQEGQGGQESALVVAGDFNAPSWSHSMRTLRAGTGLSPMPRPIPTWPAWPLALPQFPIDHVLTGHGVALEAITTGPAAGSDHLPLIARLRLDAPLPARPQD